jgi:hypothetical protein
LRQARRCVAKRAAPVSAGRSAPPAPRPQFELRLLKPETIINVETGGGLATKRSRAAGISTAWLWRANGARTSGGTRCQAQRGDWPHSGDAGVMDPTANQRGRFAELIKVEGRV